MKREQEVQSIDASFSDFCSVGERINQSNREQLLSKENIRLRREHSEISEKYIKMCNEMSKVQTKLIDKQRKITELDLFYKKQIEQLKKELHLKSNQLSKFQKQKGSRNNAKGKENECDNMKNSQNLQVYLQNQSFALTKMQQQNLKLHQLLATAVQLIQKGQKCKQKSEISKRICNLRKQLEQKGSLDAIYARSNGIVEEIKARGQQNHDYEISRLLGVLRNKSMQLKKIPITLDYDVEAQSQNLQVLMASLDIQMRLLGKNSEEKVQK